MNRDAGNFDYLTQMFFQVSGVFVKLVSKAMGSPVWSRIPVLRLSEAAAV